MLNKQILARNFSRCASHYDRYADVQRLAGKKLLAEIEAEGFSKILELGCGTGNFTQLLTEKFRPQAVLALDISRPMVELAQAKLKDQKLEFIVADAEEIYFKERFDLIASNACFQWFADLEKAIVSYKELLDEEGHILFSMFGPQTFRELNASLKLIFQEASIAAQDFLALERVEEILAGNFSDFRVREIRHQEAFADLKEMLTKIKYSGIKGNGLGKDLILSSSKLKKLESAYLSEFGAIRATYQIFLCQAQR
jgi:malonyl-CoA O-methyltransferase